MPLMDSIPFCRKEAVRQIPIFPEVQEGAASLASFLSSTGQADGWDGSCSAVHPAGTCSIPPGTPAG